MPEPSRCPRCAEPLADEPDGPRCAACAETWAPARLEPLSAIDGLLDEVLARPLPAGLRADLLRRLGEEKARLLAPPAPRPVSLPEPAPEPAPAPPAPPRPLIPPWLRHLGPAMTENVLYLLGAFLLVAGAVYFTSTAWTTMGGGARLLVLQGGLATLALLVLGVARLAARVADRDPALARLTRAAAHIAALHVPLVAVTSGRLLDQSLPLGLASLLGTLALGALAWRPLTADLPPPLRHRARLTLAALSTLAALVALLPAPLLVGAAVLVAARSAPPGLLPQLAVASAAAAGHVAVVVGAFHPLGVLAAAWALALARAPGERGRDLLAVGLACAALAPALGDPTSMLAAAAAGAVAVGLVGLRRGSVRLFVPALLLSLVAYLFLPAPVRALAEAARDAFAAGLGYGGQPLPLAWYGLTCLPYLIGCAALARALTPTAPRHARAVRAWITATAAGLCLLSLGADDLRAPAAVLGAEGVTLVALGLWLRSRLLTAAGPVALAAGAACVGPHLDWSVAASLLLVEGALLALVAATWPLARRRDPALVPPLLWSAALPTVVAAVPLSLPLAGNPLARLDLATFGLLAAVTATYGARRRDPRGAALAALFATRALVPLVPAAWHLALAALVAGATLLAGRRSLRRAGGALGLALALLALQAIYAGLHFDGAPPRLATGLGTGLVTAWLLATAARWHQRWAAALAVVLAPAPILSAALGAGRPPEDALLPAITAAGLLALAAARWLPRSPRVRRSLVPGLAAAGAGLALLGTAAAWLALPFDPPPGPLALAAGLALAAALLGKAPAPLRALAGATLTLPALLLLLLAAHHALDPAATLLLLTAAAWLALVLPAAGHGPAAALGWGTLTAALVAGDAGLPGWHLATLASVAAVAWLAAPVRPRWSAVLLTGATLFALCGPLAAGLLDRPLAWQPPLWAALALLLPELARWRPARLHAGTARAIAWQLGVAAALGGLLLLDHRAGPWTFTLLALGSPVRWLRDRAPTRVEHALYLLVPATYAWLVYLVPRTGTAAPEILLPMALLAAALAGAAALLARRVPALLGERLPRAIALLCGLAVLEVAGNLAALAHQPARPAAAAAGVLAMALVVGLAAARARATRRAGWIDLALAAGALAHLLLALRTDWLAPLDGRHALVWAGLALALHRPLGRRALLLPIPALLVSAPHHLYAAEAALLTAAVYGLLGRRTTRPGLLWLALGLIDLAAFRLWLAWGVIDPAFYGIPMGLTLLAGAYVERHRLPPARAGALQLGGLALAALSLALPIARVESPAHALAMFVLGLAAVAVGWYRRRGDLLIAGAAVVVLDTALHLARSGFAHDFLGAGLLVLTGAVVLTVATLHARRRAAPPDQGKTG